MAFGLHTCTEGKHSDCQSSVFGIRNNMLALYIHIPYCVRKCPYCGFYSTPYTEKGADEFIAALRWEAKGCQAEFNNRLFQSVYIGGGTPTALSPEQMRQVLDTARTYFKISAVAEYTVEANPNSLSTEHLRILRDGGANRLSLGVQSFSDAILHKLGRLHTAEQAEQAFHLARRAGFANISVDLIYGIPGQTDAQWDETLQKAIRCGPEHISVYSLSLDEGSKFHQLSETGNFERLDDDRAAGMYEFAVAALAAAGYRRYEISNTARPGFECRHNQNYWNRGEYLGLGPGASSFIPPVRRRNIADTEEYNRRMADGISAIGETEEVGPEQASRETILLSLRTREGLDLHRYQLEYGDVFLKRLETNMASLVAAGLLDVKEERATLTQRGILLLNEALVRLAA